MTESLSPTLLTPETSLVLILDYQQHVMEGIHSTDRELIELNGRALARATKVFKVPVILSTIGVKLRGDHATLPSIRGDLAGEPDLVSANRRLRRKRPKLRLVVSNPEPRKFMNRQAA